MRADAAAPAAPVGAHARASARIHVHRREPLYNRPRRDRAPDRHPMLLRLDEYAPPRAWGRSKVIGTLLPGGVATLRTFAMHGGGV